MISVPEEIKFLLQQDSVPKNMRIHFPDGEHEDLNNENLGQDSAKFTESLCSRDELKFGLCEKSQFEVDIYNIEDIKGSLIEVELDIDVENVKTVSPNVFIVTEGMVRNSSDPDLIRTIFSSSYYEMQKPVYYDLLGMEIDPFEFFKHVYYAPTKRLYTLNNEWPSYRNFNFSLMKEDRFVEIDKEDLHNFPFMTLFSDYARKMLVTKRTSEMYFPDQDGMYTPADGPKPYADIVSEINNLYFMKIGTHNILFESHLAESLHPDDPDDYWIDEINDKGQPITQIFGSCFIDGSNKEDPDFLDDIFVIIAYIRKDKPYKEGLISYDYTDEYTYTIFVTKMHYRDMDNLPEETTESEREDYQKRNDFIQKYLGDDSKPIFMKEINYLSPTYKKYDDILYKYPNGSKRSSHLSYRYFPINYGRFIVDECDLNDTKLSRHIVSYSRPLVTDKICKSEKDKMEWATRVKKKYIPNIVGFVCSQSNIDPEYYGTFTKTANFSSVSVYGKLNPSNAAYKDRDTLVYLQGTIPAYKSYIYSGMNTYTRNYGGNYLTKPWISCYKDSNNHRVDVYLESIQTCITLTCFRFNSGFNFNKEIVYRLNYNNTSLSKQLYDILDDESSDYGNIGTYIAQLCEEYDSTYFTDDNIIRKVVFSRLLKERLARYTKVSRKGCFPRCRVMYQIGTTAKKMESSYDVTYGSVYLFGNSVVNKKTGAVTDKSNTKSATIDFPYKLSVGIKKIDSFNVTRDENGKVIDEEGKTYTFSDFKDVITISMSDEEIAKMELSEFTIIDDKFVIDFPFISDGQEKQDSENGEEVEKFIPDEDVDVSKYANAMLEINGQFGYWNRILNTYGVKKINTLTTNALQPNYNVFPANYNSTNQVNPAGPNHHIRKEEYTSLTVDDEEKVPIKGVKYKNHMDSKDEEGNDMVEEFEETYGTGGSEQSEYNKTNIYDLTENILFNNLKKVMKPDGVTVKENPAEDLAKKAYNNIKDVGYMPASIEMMGRPYLEAGDSISFELVYQKPHSIKNLTPKDRTSYSNTSYEDSVISEETATDDPVFETVGYSTIAFRRTLSGIQHLRDSIESK